MNSIKAILLLLIVVLSANGCGYIPSTIFYKDPLTATEHNNLGVAYEREGKYDLAERQYKNALGKNSEFTPAYVNLGNVYFNEGKYDKAGKYYKKALELDPDNILAANNLGNVYLEKNEKYDEAINLLSGLFDTVEEMPAFYLDTLARLYLGSGDMTRALSLLESACRKAGEDNELINSINDLLRELGGGECSMPVK